MGHRLAQHARWVSAPGSSEPRDLAHGRTPAAAQPLDVLVPALRGVFGEVEISSDLGTVGELFGPTHQAAYSASGNEGTLEIPVTSHEEIRQGFLSAITLCSLRPTSFVLFPGSGVELLASPRRSLRGGSFMARRCGISVAHRVLGVLGAALILAVAPSPAAQAEEFSLEPGDIVIADSGFDGKIIRVDPVTGTQTVIANGGLLEDPFGIAIDVNGDLLVTDAGAIPAIIRIERATGAQSVLSSGGEFVAPDGIAIDPASGDLVVADRDALTCCGDPPSGAILRVDPATGAQSIVSFGGTVATGESFFNPAGIAIEASGDLLVADFDAFFGPGAIFRVDPASGAQTVVREGPDPSAGFLGIAIDADGQLLVTNAGGADGLGDVFRIDPTTGDQTLVSTGGNLGEPYGIAIDSNGDILVSDSQSQALIRIDPVTGDQTLVSSGGFFLSPRRMVVVRDPEANAVAIDITPGSDPNSINPASTGLSPVAILGSDTFDVLDLDPRLAFGPSGAAPVHRGGPHYEDVNDDDRTDLLAHFDSQETGIAFGDTQACVTGETLEGIPFEACDDIRTVPACGMGLELVILLTPVMWLRNRRRRNPK